MRSTEERILLLHKRAAKIKKEREKKILGFTGSASAGLLVLLFALLIQTNGMVQCVSENQFAGTSMLSVNVGGYVLVAIATFITAVIITVFCFRWKKKNQKDPDNAAMSDPEEEKNR